LSAAFVLLIRAKKVKELVTVCQRQIENPASSHQHTYFETPGEILVRFSGALGLGPDGP
jgi:hypothetical protein